MKFLLVLFLSAGVFGCKTIQEKICPRDRPCPVVEKCREKNITVELDVNASD